MHRIDKMCIGGVRHSWNCDCLHPLLSGFVVESEAKRHDLGAGRNSEGMSAILSRRRDSGWVFWIRSETKKRVPNGLTKVL